jgi:sugar phosphate isomerase/epimerase
MIIALQSLVTYHCNLLTDLRIARETGYNAIEINGTKLKRYLAQGYPLASLLPWLKDTPAVAMTYIQDIERQKPAQYAALLQETEALCALAEGLDCPMVQLLTGPLDPTGPYQGLTGMDWPEQRRLTARNLAALADIGKAHNVKFFIEALTWAPLHRLDQTLEVIDAAGRDNLGLVIDFWHLWDGGATPDEVARVDRRVIYNVHACDSLEQWGERGTHEQRGRDVWMGAGRIPLKEWVDAVRATGYDGPWMCELLSPKYWELDPWNTARDLRVMLEYLLV